jgi:type IV secretion system protein VirB10
MSHLRGLLLLFLVILVTSVSPLRAIDADRDFSGKWILERESGDSARLPLPPDSKLLILQKESVIECSTAAAHWTYKLDGNDSRYQIGDSKMNTAVKWEGAALLINTLVSGKRDYAIMDRWRLSRDHATLNVTRQVVVGGSQLEATLVYRNENVREPAPPAPVETPELSRRPEAPPTEPAPASTEEILVPKGTRILLSLVNTLSTKQSQEGDRVYLQTAFPVALDNRIVIPKGSSVIGTLTQAKKPGRVSGKGELYIRFDSLTLPNGVTRDLRSRLSNADASTKGEVDRGEGKVTSESNRSGDARRVGETTAAGASVGGIAGAASGHAGMGVGIGAAAGAAAGLASVFGSRGPDAVLRRGTTVEMMLDRDLSFRRDELLR